MTPTQEDREAAEKLADMICGCATREQHKRDVAAILDALAAAEERGARLALEAAAKVADTYQEKWSSAGGFEGHSAAARIVATAIRQIDPAALEKRHD